MSKVVALEEYAKQRARRIGFFKKYGITVLFLAPFLLAFIVFFVVPLFYGIYISLTNFQYGKPGVETFNSFSWYRMLFDKNYLPGVYKTFWLAFIHTIIFAVIMVDRKSVV